MVSLKYRLVIFTYFMMIQFDQIIEIRCQKLPAVTNTLQSDLSDIIFNFPPIIQNPTTRALCRLRTVLTIFGF